MYLPAHFNESRIDVLHGAMRDIGFATLVTSKAGAMTATHLPLLVDAEPGPNGALIGHVARANPQWRDFGNGTDSLAIFLGPQSYISPNWYPSKREHAKVVPTWNYIAIHAYGPLEIVEDRAALLGIVTRLTERYEASSAVPWKVSDAPKDFLDQMVKAIVGLRLPIARIEGKWKLSQNRAAPDRLGTIAGLEGKGEPAAMALAAAMRAREK